MAMGRVTAQKTREGFRIIFAPTFLPQGSQGRTDALKLRGAAAQAQLAPLAFHLLGQQVRVLAEPVKLLDCAPG